jgi:hypothetical protein
MARIGLSNWKDLSEAKRRLALTRLYGAAATRDPEPVARIPPRPADEPVPLSFGQEQIWLHSQLAPGVPLYTEAVTIRRRGPLDVPALAESFRDIVRRHEIWRTTFDWFRSDVVQIVHPYRGCSLAVEDVSSLPEAERETAAIRAAERDVRRPFDLSAEPGVRGTLVTLSREDHRLFLALHHVVFDGVSIYRVFLPELVSLYEARVNGRRDALPPPALQYGDFAYWQRRKSGESSSEVLERYWREHLSGAPFDTSLPADYPRPRAQTFRGGLLRFELPSAVTAAARSAAASEECTLFMFLLASFETALYSFAHQTDLVVATVSAGRDHPELENLIGYFLRMLVIRTDLSGNPPFREIIARVRSVLLNALCHENLPFQRLVQVAAADRNLRRSPLFQVTFSIEPPMLETGPQWDITEMDVETRVSKFDLSIELEDRGDVISGRAIYSADLFHPATVSTLLSKWKTLLELAAADPQQHLNDLVKTA